jgi:thiamine pyrophosphate-dependent acetolactate synthase large subunit-like protein
MAAEPTIWDVTYDLLRELGLTTVFGNPGSTEQTFLKNFPDGTEQLAKEFNAALGADGPTVIVVSTKPQVAHLG